MWSIVDWLGAWGDVGMGGIASAVVAPPVTQPHLESIAAGWLGFRPGLGPGAGQPEGAMMADAWKKATDRAEKLFLSLLTPTQQREWEEKGYCSFTGSHGTRFRLSASSLGVYEYKTDYRSRYRHLCVYVRTADGPLPPYDHYAGILLVARADEKKLKSIANPGAWMS